MKTIRTPGPGAERLRVLLEGVSDKVGKVGVFETSKYEDGTPVAYVAVIQEHGSPAQGIPPRPFMRTTIAEKTPEWQELARRSARAMLKGDMTGEQALELIGLKAAGDIRKTISKITSPPLKDATIAARLSARADKQTVGKLTKPLVDTGTLLNSITNTVEAKS